MKTLTSIRRIARGAALATGSVALALFVSTLSPSVASADAVSEMQAVQQQVSEANAAYADATARVDELQAQIDANEAHIAELEAELPGLREQAAASMRTLYKLQQGSSGLLELLLSAENFYDLLSTIQYLDVIQSHSTDSVEQLLVSVDELEITRITLESQMQQAEEEAAAAEQALAEANAARAALQAQIEAQAAAEAAERQAAIEAAKKAQEESADATFTTESGNGAQVQTPSNESTESVDWSSDKAAFVSEWTGRIDAFLAGSPLAGYGSVFAEAAWEYGVDPRFSPAISQVESGRGTYCFLPHNAWGWGSVSWGSWEEAIWAHVAGLASGYGGQLTYAGACKYCPPNADLWYAAVLANMQSM